MNIFNILLVGAGGCLGSVARYVTVVSIDKRLNGVFPYGTLAVNVLGSFLLGFVMAMLVRKTGSHLQEWKLFLGTGFCGGFTTFSAFAAENVGLFQQKFPATAILYIAGSVLLGLLAVWLGFAMARNIG
jgi:fluoride exporter